jgi:hypothetical protein
MDADTPISPTILNTRFVSTDDKLKLTLPALAGSNAGSVSILLAGLRGLFF